MALSGSGFDSRVLHEGLNWVRVPGDNDGPISRLASVVVTRPSGRTAPLEGTREWPLTRFEGAGCRKAGGSIPLSSATDAPGDCIRGSRVVVHCAARSIFASEALWWGRSVVNREWASPILVAGANPKGGAHDSPVNGRSSCAGTSQAKVSGTGTPPRCGADSSARGPTSPRWRGIAATRTGVGGVEGGLECRTSRYRRRGIGRKGIAASGVVSSSTSRSRHRTGSFLGGCDEDGGREVAMEARWAWEAPRRSAKPMRPIGRWRSESSRFR